ncbi:MAG TPA: type II asparaginase [Pseudomonas sp.]|uniref:type II asparaginase n=1 Tax=Pseudomonas sp. TaxID=306 RepID=UPI002B47B434|nr:type II asparaginase [Pseudomonas sp.]HKS12572.1 type II asparaginase [Pseudomonas sp.]
MNIFNAGVCAAVLSFTSVVDAMAATLPNVAVLATGGTIAGTAPSATQTTGYQSGVLTAQALIASVPSIGQVANLSAEQVANVGSDNVDNEILLTLAKRVNSLLARDDISGVVITHGTDTLEETAYFLNLVVKSDKPVVVTGSMRPSTAIGADGPSNLLQAVTVASDPQARGRGVMIVLNDRIGSARFISKTDANALDTFGSSEGGYLGRLVNQQPRFETRVAREHTTATPFDISTLEHLPKVDIIYGYQNDNGYMFDAAVAHQAKGIVIAGVGAGSESRFIIPAVKRAMEQGVTVVRSSRSGSGFVPADEAYPGLLGDSLNPQKARILLMLALSVTQDPARIQDMFHRF